MSDAVATTPPADSLPPAGPARAPRRWLRRTLRVLGWSLVVLVILLVAVRLAMPSVVRYYVNQTLQRNPMFRGEIDGIRISLWRGAYSIENVRFVKTTGNVPVPLFRADRIDLSIEWNALLHGKVVGKVRMDAPELNFVDAPPAEGQKGEQDPGDQTGADGPWLAMLSDLFPFQINRVDIVDGSVHFRTYQDRTPVDVYLSEMTAIVDNLTNVRDETTPLATTVQIRALAMDQARFQCNVKLNPFSYRPTFHLTMRLLNLDVTKVNALTRTYGSFDFERGWFDLVVDLDSKEGALYGYVKPLFRNLAIFTPQDMKEDNVFQAFWEAMVGGAEFVLKNQPRDQFGTIIPFTGDVDSPTPSILDTVGNVLRNAFIRAYLPRLETPAKIDDPELRFGPASLLDPTSDEDFKSSD